MEIRDLLNKYGFSINELHLIILELYWLVNRAWSTSIDLLTWIIASLKTSKSLTYNKLLAIRFILFSRKGLHRMASSSFSINNR
jgi:hypothetical protein